MKIHLKLFTLEAMIFLEVSVTLDSSTNTANEHLLLVFVKTFQHSHMFQMSAQNERIGNVAETLTAPTQTTFSADSYMLTEQMIMNFICRMF